jgi:hypothetical protein
MIDAKDTCAQKTRRTDLFVFICAKLIWAKFNVFLTYLMHIVSLNAVPRKKYCESINKTVRRKTRTVLVGNVPLGSEHPVRVQTMTTTDTKDVAATVEQVLLTFLAFQLFLIEPLVFDCSSIVARD